MIGKIDYGVSSLQMVTHAIYIRVIIVLLEFQDKDLNNLSFVLQLEGEESLKFELHAILSISPVQSFQTV